jgi:hypothetical protein
MDGLLRSASETVVCDTFSFAAMSRNVMGGVVGMDKL